MKGWSVNTAKAVIIIGSVLLLLIGAFFLGITVAKRQTDVITNSTQAFRLVWDEYWQSMCPGSDYGDVEYHRERHYWEITIYCWGEPFRTYYVYPNGDVRW